LGPIGSQYEPTIYLARLSRYWASGSRSWPFGVTWRQLSRDHWIRNIEFPIGGQFEPTVYLAVFEILSFKRIGPRLWPFGSRDVISHMTTGFPRCGFLFVVHTNRPGISHGCWDIDFKDIGITPLTFWGHVTSSVTWPLDSQHGVSYRWSIRTDRLSRTVTAILSLKCIGVTTLTFRVTWRHRSCDHWIPKVWFPIGSQYEPTMCLTQLLRY